MVDLFVDFGSNAPGVTREVDSLTRSFAAAEAKTKQIAQATAGVERAYRGVASAARTAADASRRAAADMSRPLTTGSTVFSGNAAQIKTNVARALAASNRETRIQMGKNGEEAGGSFSAGLRRTLEKSLNRGGFFGAKDSLVTRGLTAAGASPSAAAGLSATLAIGAAYLTLAKAVEIANAALDGHKDRLSRVATGQLENMRLMREARDANRAAGVSAAQDHGTSILQVAGLGGQGALDDVRQAARDSGKDENDAAALYGTLYSNYRGDAGKIRQGLKISADVSRVTGKSLAETGHTLGEPELADPAAARDRLNSLGHGLYYTENGSFAKSAANVASVPDAVKVQAIGGSLANADANRDKTLGAGVTGAMDLAARAADPGAAIITEHLRALHEQQAVLDNIDENTKGWARVFDRLFNPASTVHRERLAGEDRINLVSGSGAAPAEQ